LAPISDLQRAEARGEAVVRTLDDLGHARAAAFQRSRQQAVRMRATDKSDGHKFELDDMVKIRNFRKLKFQYDFLGPFYITGFGPNHTYYLKDTRGTPLKNLYPHVHLAPFLDNSQTFTRSYYHVLANPDGSLPGFDDDPEQTEDSLHQKGGLLYPLPLPTSPGIICLLQPWVALPLKEHGPGALYENRGHSFLFRIFACLQYKAH
jgi:hypothetical protein